MSPALASRSAIAPLDGPKEVGSGLLREEQITLSRLIDLLNERFGTDFNQADQFFFDQITEIAIDDERLQQAAKMNPADKFSLVFGNLLEARSRTKRLSPAS